MFRNKKYDVYISNIVLNEISGCNEEKLNILLEYLNEIEYTVVETHKYDT